MTHLSATPSPLTAVPGHLGASVAAHPAAGYPASADHPSGASHRGRLRLVPCLRGDARLDDTTADTTAGTTTDTTPDTTASATTDATTGTTTGTPAGVAITDRAGEDGSLVAEYGLLAVVAATVAGVLITWARGGALAGFFDALLSSARGLVGA